ncbi:MAG: BppU family phage baseplate upper protein [Cetobacterium sp.]
MKNESIRKTINVDKPNHTPIWTFKQEDDGVLRLNLYKGSTALDITGQTIKLGAKRPNNSIIELIDGFSINKNELDITLKNNILAVPGTIECDLEITDASGKMTTASFYFLVSKKMTGENTLNASNDISAINKLVEDIKKDYDSLQKIIIDENQAANLQDQVNKTNTQLDSKANKGDVIKKGYGTLNDFDEDTRATIQGIRPGSVNAVLGYKNVTPENTNFFNDSANLLDSDLLIEGEYVNHVYETTPKNPNYKRTSYIYLEKGTYTSNFTNPYGVIYDNNKTKVQAIDNKNFTLLSDGYVRLTFGIGESKCVLYKGDVLLPYVPYKKTINNKFLELTHEDIDLSRFKLDINNCNFAKNINLFDKTKATDGKYINSANGQLANNASYVASDFIQVEPNQVVTFSTAYFKAFYDKDKNYVVGDYNGNNQIYTCTVPSNAYFVRNTFKLSDKDKAMIVIGDTLPTEYISYGYKIDEQYLPKGTPNEISKDIFELKLPTEIVVGIGVTFELYNKQICFCGNINNYHFMYSGKGKTMNRKWTITPTTADLGTSTLTVTVYDNNMNIIKTATTILKVVDKSVNKTEVKLLSIGDSLTNNKAWQGELEKLINAKFGNGVLKQVGTKGYGTLMHEGRSGWTANNYVTNSEYSFEGNIKVKVTNLTVEPISKKQYIVDGTNQKFEVEEILIENGEKWIYLNRISGGGVTTNGVLVAVETSTQGDNRIPYTNAIVTSKNPFWNQITNKLDFADYTSRTGITPNIVHIMLGTNGIGSDTHGVNVSNDIEILVNEAKKVWNCKVLVSCIPYYSNQDGLSINTPTVFELRRKWDVFMVHKALIEKFNNVANVNVVALGQSNDADFNFGAVMTKVNPRSEYLEPMPKEGTHPQDGYLQMADSIYGYLVNAINTL